VRSRPHPVWGLEHVNGISAQCKKGPPPRRPVAPPPLDWWQLLLDGVLVPHWIHANDTKFEGFALEGELQRWAFQQVAQLDGRRPLVNQRASYPDPHVEYPCPDSGVVCVVEITAAFWGRYQHAYFDLGALGIKIGQGGEEQ
jgi:hypothetical protein